VRAVGVTVGVTIGVTVGVTAARRMPDRKTSH